MAKFLLPLLGFVALNAAAQNVGEPRLHVLDNGLRVVTVEDHSAPLVSAVWSAHVGDSAEPPDFAGNSHYLEHLLLFRGTEKYPKNEIGEWAAGRGGYFNGYTWYDYTAFVLMTAIDDLDGILDRHEQMMFHGSFSGQDFETEKKAVFEELRSGLDTPYGYIWRASSYHMYPEETFYSRSTIGTIETVQAATVERVREYYKNYYVPNNMTLAVVGDFDTDDLLHKIEQRLGSYPAGDVPDSIYEPVAMKSGVNVMAEERDLGKSYFLLAVDGPRANSPEYFPYKVLAEYLAGGKTSVLYSDLVTEKGLLDEVSMGAFARRYAKGWQGIDGETSSDEVEAAVDALWKAIEQVKRTGLSDEDLEFSRQRLLKTHWQDLDDINEVAESLAVADANGDYRLFADFEKRLSAVTAADVQAVAKKYLTPSDFFLMAVFPPGEIPADFAVNIKANAERLSAGSGSVVRTQLASGAVLLHEAKQSAPMESYTVAIHAGGKDGDSAGVAEAAANMMVRETATYSKNELQDLLDENGFTLSSSTSSDATYISVQAPAGNTDAAMALLIEVLTNPAFSASEWSDTRAEMIASLESSKDQPRWVAGDLLMGSVYAGTRYGRTNADELVALEEMSPKDLKTFWSRYYKAKAIAVAYTGGAAASQVQAGLAPLSKLKGAAPLRPPISVPAIEGVTHTPQAMAGKTQINLFIGWRAPEIGSDDWILWQLAEKAIGGDLAGRLWKLRQDEGLAYSVWLFGTNFVEQPLTTVYMATAGENREAALAAIHREVGRAQSGLSQEELDRVKVSYLAQLNRVDRTAARRSDRHAEWWISGFDVNRREHLTEVIGAATLQEVNRVIRDVLDPESYVFVEAGAIAE
ncbi:MAG: M16 family metallopeptidase [Woeseiaceae bacterium]